MYDIMLLPSTFSCVGKDDNDDYAYNDEFTMIVMVMMTLKIMLLHTKISKLNIFISVIIS